MDAYFSNQKYNAKTLKMKSGSLSKARSYLPVPALNNVIETRGEHFFENIFYLKIKQIRTGKFIAMVVFTDISLPTISIFKTVISLIG